MKTLNETDYLFQYKNRLVRDFFRGVISLGQYRQLMGILKLLEATTHNIYKEKINV